MPVELIKELINIASPSGYTGQVLDHIAARLAACPYQIRRTNKGALLVSVTESPELLISAHVDTLGGMVKYLNDNGTLELTQIGGWPPNSFEGEHVTIVTQADKTYRGTFLLNNPAAHVNREVSSTERKMDKMHIRVDALTTSKKETEELGIAIGDYVLFDPRFEYTATGFVKSRFLDDKACAGIMLDILLNHQETVVAHNIGFFFSNYEEVGHGGSAGIPGSVRELLVADMGVVGEKVAGRETAVSICAKDSNGPYDYEMRRELVALAQSEKIPHIVDIFPFYGSDGGAALAAGMDLRVGLIGPGVSSSHGVERTHIQGIQATRDLILAFIKTMAEIA
ncbi:MAG: M42 family metallopeptidase [Candidatus Neomarinimicrobiota bacterium]